jgi:nitrite reductase/ring-hydroxylating ferredoxin subunit
MSNFIEVEKTSELEDGTMKEVVIQRNRILLAKAGDRYYAVDSRSPHLGGKLASGKH